MGTFWSEKVKMDKLFDKQDVLTITTADQAIEGDRGYFGDNLTMLATNVKQGDIHSLDRIYESTLFPFKGDHHVNCFGLFLPADKVKNKEPVYRPIKTIDELFSFLVPSVPKDDYNTLDKVGIISCTLFELKDKQLGCIYYKKFTCIRVAGDNIRLDACALEHYFNNYEIKINGEFVPFGVIE